MKRQKLFRATLISLPVLAILMFSVFASSSPPAVSGQQLAGANAVSALDWQSKVDAAVLAAATAGQTEFLVYMSQRADLSGAEALATKEEKSRVRHEA